MSKKQQFIVEYMIKSSPGILFSFLTTPSNLAQWFADDVDVTEDTCVFTWNGSDETAHILEFVEDELVRYRWEDSPENEYFEFKISKAEITNDTILTITDFAEDFEIEDQKLLWDSQIKTLIQRIGG